MRFLLALAITAVSLLATDVSGKWSGSFDPTVDGETHNDSALLILKQDGDKITGTAGPNEEKQFEIRKASLDGNTLKIGADPAHYQQLVAAGDSAKSKATIGAGVAPYRTSSCAISVCRRMSAS